MKHYTSVQNALDDALKEKGKSAKILFLMDGAMTAPIL